jgi:hypothetical protein
MSRSSHPWKVCAVASALVVSIHAPGLAQEPKEAPAAKSKLAVVRAERASGVIVKVEPIAKVDSGRSKHDDSKETDADKAHRVRLTINTDAVWRDWARDQVSANATQTPKKAAEKGAKSVATKGEPQTANSLVVIALTPASKVETRFRTLTDETTKGAKTASAARSDEPGRSKSRDSKSPHFAAADLRPGLFVEVDFRRHDGADQASTVTVIRPVSEQGVPTESGKP